MSLSLTATSESWPLRSAFAISRGVKTAADVVQVTVTDAQGRTGSGEGVPYARYGETMQGTLDALAAVSSELIDPVSARALVADRLTGAAANALDCALWDLEARRKDSHVSALIGRDLPDQVPTAETLSIDTPDAMSAAATAIKGKLIKIKLGADDPVARVAAVHAARPDAGLILDANEGWDIAQYRAVVPQLAELGVAMIEQPLPAGADQALRGEARPVPLCADESVHKAEDMVALADRYDLVNIKLDKAGGLTGALAAAEAAEAVGLGIMVGCMVGTSLAMSPGLMLSDRARFIDLDGPLWLAEDRQPGLLIENGIIMKPSQGSWR